MQPFLNSAESLSAGGFPWDGICGNTIWEILLPSLPLVPGCLFGQHLASGLVNGSRCWEGDTPTGDVESPCHPHPHSLICPSLPLDYF